MPRGAAKPRVYSGATNNVDRSVRQHNQRRAGGSHTVRGWGTNARLVLLIGPFARTEALSLERRLKNTLIREGGIQGRLKALIRLLQAPDGLQSKSVHLTTGVLREIPVYTPLSRQHVARLVGVSSDALALIGNFPLQFRTAPRGSIKIKLPATCLTLSNMTMLLSNNTICSITSLQLDVCNRRSSTWS